MKRYKNYLFDLDGTLINTLDLIIECFRHSLHYAARLQVPEEKIREGVGLPLLEQFKNYLGHLPDIDYEDVIREHMDYQLKHWRGKVFVYAGIKTVLQHLKKDGARLAVVTSRRKKTSKLYTKELAIFDYFEFFTTPESTKTHKPDPGPALYALDRLKADPRHTLFIGDSAFDMECGHRAGVETAFAEWGGGRPSAQYRATYVLKNPRELLS